MRRLGDKVNAMKANERNIQRNNEYARRMGRHMAPRTFTLNLETAHDQHNYSEPRICKLYPPRDFEERLRGEITSGKSTKAEGADGIHTEILQAAREEWVSLHITWWEASGRIGVLPKPLEEGILCPLYQKGVQEDPRNYRPVFLLSHARKAIARPSYRWSMKSLHLQWISLGSNSGSRYNRKLYRYRTTRRKG